jgi:hypothetical protein
MENTYKLPVYCLRLLVLSITIPLIIIAIMYASGCTNFTSPNCGVIDGWLFFIGMWLVPLANLVIIVSVITTLASFIWRKHKGLYITRLHRILSLVITIAIILSVVIGLIML